MKERCDGVMDSARYFNLLGEVLPQVRVLARALALLGFVNTNVYLILGLLTTSKVEKKKNYVSIVR